MKLAAIGVSVTVFDQVSKIAILPHVSITTSFVDEEDATGGLTAEEHEDAKLEGGFAANKEMEELLPKSEATYESSYMSSTLTSGSMREGIPSASSALLFGCVLGVIQALFVIFSAKPILNYMGVNSVNYINAHTTSTLASDLTEINVIKRVFKNTSEIKINATKSMIGHCLGVAGDHNNRMAASQIQSPQSSLTLLPTKSNNMK